MANKNIKVSELFYSIQGEGRYMGVPSVFLRTFGCNFTCGGFGMPKGDVSAQRSSINIKRYKEYKDLPLVSTGCDSYASWDPNFKHLSPLLNIDTIADNIVNLLPKGRWQEEHLVITGGEPLLGWQRSYPDLLSHEKMLDLKELTFETNGTQPLSDTLSEFLVEWAYQESSPRGFDALTFSVSPKLSMSGEKWEDAIKPDVVADYESHGYTYLKFVVSDKTDVEEAEEAVHSYRSAGFKGPVYLMPLGGVEEVYALNNKNVAELALSKGYRYSDRLQVPLFRNAHGT
jgi:organic radical activating enzyme